MNTDYNLYKIFLYLYEEKSISRTASKLYVSQPAISYSLKELESQLGYTLFYRNSKGIEPTVEAKELYGYISTAFNIINDAEEHIKNLNDLNIGCIRIGTSSHIGSFYLSSFIAEFKKKYPSIQFEIICRSTSDMIEMLETRNLDIIVDTLPITGRKNITKKTLSKLPNCFAFYKDYYHETNINSLEDLKKYPLILPNESSSIRLKLDEFMKNNNIELTPNIVGWTTDITLDMVRRGLGIGYFIQEVIDTQVDRDQFHILSFDNTLPEVEICYAYIDEFLTMASRKFIELLNNQK